MSDPLIGRTLGRYQILTRVRTSVPGMSYEARDYTLDRRVVVTIFPPHSSDQPEVTERIVREMRAASALNHPSIVTIYEVGTAEGHPFIVREFLEGLTLRERLQTGALPIHEALDIARQVAEGLAYAHRSGIVHRDINPSNLILSRQGVRILDFGVVRVLSPADEDTGPILANAAYISPEQLHGRTIDGRTDVWSLGVVLYEMLVGHVPFRSENAFEVISRIIHDAPSSLRAQRPEIPDDVEHLVLTALNKEPSARFRSAEEFALALRRALRSESDDLAETAAIEADTATLAIPDTLGWTPASTDAFTTESPDRLARVTYVLAAILAVVTIIISFKVIQSFGRTSSFSAWWRPLAASALVVGGAAIAVSALRHVLELIVAVRVIKQLRGH
jgi:serine/threonine-protein kinase